MKLGLLTAPFPETSIEDIADWSAANGFSMLEVCCWPSDEGSTRRYGGICHIDVDGMTQDRADEIVADLAGRGIGISGLGYYPNPLHPDADHRQAVSDHLKKVITAASLMGVPVVNTFIGADSAVISRGGSDSFENSMYSVTWMCSGSRAKKTW